MIAAFDADAISSDAGRCFWAGLIEHEIVSLVGQRVFGIAHGYEDLNDHDESHHDPLMAVLAGKLEARREDCAPVARKSTLIFPLQGRVCGQRAGGGRGRAPGRRRDRRRNVVRRFGAAVRDRPGRQRKPSTRRRWRNSSRPMLPSAAASTGRWRSSSPAACAEPCTAWPNIINVLCDRLRKTDDIAEVALLQLPARLAKALTRA